MSVESVLKFESVLEYISQKVRAHAAAEATYLRITGNGIPLIAYRPNVY